MLAADFFDRDAQAVARDLVGKVLRRRVGAIWLAAQVVEVEAYYRREKGSHASLGRTASREALFMPPGTIYMYYARGGDSLNVSCRGAGNAVLFKAARPFVDERSPASSLARMRAASPGPRGPRPPERLCAGQTLLCRALGLRVPEWNRRSFDRERFFLEDVGYRPEALVQARRLGIPPGRDEHLPYRFLDASALRSATANPLARRGAREGVDYRVLRRRRPPDGMRDLPPGPPPWHVPARRGRGDPVDPGSPGGFTPADGG
jgi:DNA-3-methyladenine glycosylase